MNLLLEWIHLSAIVLGYICLAGFIFSCGVGVMFLWADWSYQRRIKRMRREARDGKA